MLTCVCIHISMCAFINIMYICVQAIPVLDDEATRRFEQQLQTKDDEVCVHVCVESCTCVYACKCLV